MHSVQYRSIDKPFVHRKAPYELFRKNMEFSSQHEFRIVLNPSNSKVNDLLGSDNIIHIGPLLDCAEIRTVFYDGAQIFIDTEQKKLSIVDNVAKGLDVSGTLDEWPLSSIISFMRLAYHTTSFKDTSGNQFSIDVFWREASNVLYSKYNIFIRHGEYVDWKPDEVYLLCDGDDPSLIFVNERKDKFYYMRSMNYKSSFTTSCLMGGPNGSIVNLHIWVKNNN